MPPQVTAAEPNVPPGPAAMDEWSFLTFYFKGGFF
jgi:hypothetical protein